MRKIGTISILAVSALVLAAGFARASTPIAATQEIQLVRGSETGDDRGEHRRGSDDAVVTTTELEAGDDKGGQTEVEAGDDKGGQTEVEAGDDKGGQGEVEAGDDKGGQTEVEAGDDKGGQTELEAGDDKGGSGRHGGHGSDD
jgi:hypothetical protein